MLTAFQALILITTPPSAASQNTLRLLHFPAYAPRYLYCLPLAQAILPRARDGDGGHSHPIVLIELIIGETDAAEPRSGWMSVRDGDHARVSLPSIPHFCLTGSLVTTRPSIRMYACRFVAMPWQPAVTPAAPLAHACTRKRLSIAPSWPPPRRGDRDGCQRDGVERR